MGLNLILKEKGNQRQGKDFLRAAPWCFVRFVMLMCSALCPLCGDNLRIAYFGARLNVLLFGQIWVVLQPWWISASVILHQRLTNLHGSLWLMHISLHVLVCACVYRHTVKCMSCLCQYELTLVQFACRDSLVVNILHWVCGKCILEIHLYMKVWLHALLGHYNRLWQEFAGVQKAFIKVLYSNICICLLSLVSVCLSPFKCVCLCVWMWTTQSLSGHNNNRSISLQSYGSGSSRGTVDWKDTISPHHGNSSHTV